MDSVNFTTSVPAQQYITPAVVNTDEELLKKQETEKLKQEEAAKMKEAEKFVDEFVSDSPIKIDKQDLDGYCDFNLKTKRVLGQGDTPKTLEEIDEAIQGLAATLRNLMSIITGDNFVSDAVAAIKAKNKTNGSGSNSHNTHSGRLIGNYSADKNDIIDVMELSLDFDFDGGGLTGRNFFNSGDTPYPIDIKPKGPAKKPNAGSILNGYVSGAAAQRAKELAERAEASASQGDTPAQQGNKVQHEEPSAEIGKAEKKDDLQELKAKHDK